MAKFQFSISVFTFMALLVVALGEKIAIGEQIVPFWNDAHATFYGDIHGGETMQGACGYGDLFQQGYGLETAALSTVLFNKGLTCGACYEIMCVNDPQWCIPDASIKITATNLCPPDSSKPRGNWCNPPLQHFDLSLPMFLKIVKQDTAGIIPVRYRRVLCSKKGGIRFDVKGNPNWMLVLVFNVSGVGDVVDVKIKGSGTGWVQMERNWGQNWQTGTTLQGQSLSFQVTTSDGRQVQLDNVAPINWQFGHTYEGSNNF